MASLVNLTHCGRVTHISVSNLTIIGSDNGLVPDWCQAIIWTNAGILLIQTLGTNFSEILSKIYAFSFKKMHSKMLSAKWWQICLGLNVLSPVALPYWDLNKVDKIMHFQMVYFEENYIPLKIPRFICDWVLVNYYHMHQVTSLGTAAIIGLPQLPV